MPKYLNRELSWLKFNESILDLAKDEGIPLFERLKFLSITSSNADEFFMVRVASLKDLVNSKYKGLDISGMKPQKQLKDVLSNYSLFANSQDFAYSSLIDELELEGLEIVSFKDLPNNVKFEYEKYFDEKIYPILTPIIIHNQKKFPLISNCGLNIMVELKDKETGKKSFATVRVPSNTSRVLTNLNKESKTTQVFLLEDLIESMLQKLFRSHEIIDYAEYRITRNAELDINDDDVSDLLTEVEDKLKKRKWGEVIRLEVSKNMSASMLKELKKRFKVQDNMIFRREKIDFTFLMDVYNINGFNKFKYNKYKHVYPKRYGIVPNSNMFDAIKKTDMVLHHPYDSFMPVVKFIKQAADDPNVLAIKQTLYRVSKDSPIVRSLMRAAKNGKEVTVVLELKARFDEERNIEWAKKLERAGCHVIYGVPKMKVHAKVCLVIRKEGDDIVRYTHLGTGNYNDTTAKQYTDISYFTCNPKIGEDASELFNLISGESKPEKWNSLIVSPYDVRAKILEYIQNEVDCVRDGGFGVIVIKANSINDKEIIDALWNAAEEGVYVHLIIRGICTVAPNTLEIERTERFKVSSITGRYLEHSRIFYFGNNGFPIIYCGSADMMPRNLDKRIETLFPITTENEKSFVEFILMACMCGRSKYLCNDGEYRMEDNPGPDVQKFFEQLHRMNLDDWYTEARYIAGPLLNHHNEFTVMRISKRPRSVTGEEW